MERPYNMMDVNTSDTGSHEINYTFYNVSSLDRDTDYLYSPYFYLCNIGWKLYIQKEDYINDQSYLEIYLERMEDNYELNFSCEIKYKFTLFNNDSSKNIIQSSHNPGSTSRYTFGVRDHESMVWGIPRFIPWDIVMDPYYGYVDENDDDIQLAAYLEIVKIYSHKEYCQCRICN